MPTGTFSLFSLSSPPLLRRQKQWICAFVVLPSVCALGISGPVLADGQSDDKSAPATVTIKPLRGGGFVVMKTEASNLSGIKTASPAMQQNLKMVPELISQAELNAKVAQQPVSAFMAVWQAQRKAGDRNGANRTLDVAMKIVSKERSYNTPDDMRAIAEAQAEAGDFADAKITSIKAKQGAIDRKAGDEKNAALCAVAETQAKAGDFSGAEVTFAAAKQAADKIEKGPVKVSAFCVIAEAQVKVGDLTGAKVTCAIAKQIAAMIQDVDEKSRALLSVTAAQAEIGDIAGAEATAAMIPQNTDSKVSALCTIAEAQAKAGGAASAKATVAAALQILPAIQQAHPEDYTAQNSIRDIARVQAKTNDAASAKMTASRMNEGDYKESVLCFIAEAQAKNGDIAGAKTTVSPISDGPEAKVSALCAIAEAQAKSGDIADAKTTFATANQIADSNAYKWMDANGINFTNANALYAIAKAQAKVQDFEGAKATIQEISDADRKAAALAQLASAILDEAKKQSDAQKK